MPGDEWQKRANYRLFIGYMTAHPGKKLMFMGSEFGQWHEWREHEQLDWPLLQNPQHAGLQRLNRELAKLYRAHPQFHASDCEAGGFRWSDLHNADESVFAFLRQEHGARAHRLRVQRHAGAARRLLVGRAGCGPLRSDVRLGSAGVRRLGHSRASRAMQALRARRCTATRTRCASACRRWPRCSLGSRRP